ncbi:hypothetical protein CIB48_g4425 [Xylaria polymorpha]|nr:hypothetical protein CIB48_g4425 [Xylaria polymorpha]
MPGYSSQDGGKIAEQAKVGGNAPNIRDMAMTYSSIPKAPNHGVLPNSVCLNGTALNSFAVGRKVQDLFGARHASSYTTPTPEELSREERVLLVRSRLFREYATELISNKPGSQTPEIDKEIYEKDREESFEELVEYLRTMIYHPNQYKAKAVKRVWIPKPVMDLDRTETSEDR